jgi:uncharacterized membrane protein YkoI
MRPLSKSLWVVTVALSLAAGNALAWSNQQGSKQESQLTVSKKQARQLALDRVPDGTVKSERLETQGGSPAWVINVAQYGEPEHVTTVVVDANTGAVHSGERHAPNKK